MILLLVSRDQGDDLLGELHDGDLVGVAQVDRLGEVGLEQADDPFDQVGDVAEAAGLVALAVDA